MPVKISQLPSSSQVTSDDFFPVVDSGSMVTKRVYAEQVLEYISGSSFNTLSVVSLTGSFITGTTGILTTLTSSNVTGSTARFTSITGSTITGLTLLYTTISGTNITGSTARFTSITGSFSGNLSGTSSYSQDSNLLDGFDSSEFPRLSTNNTFIGTNIFGIVTASQGLIQGDLRILGTASINQLNTIGQTSLLVGDKYITILSGGIDHTGINGAGILWGTSSGPGETTGSLGEHAHITYDSSRDALEVFPGLYVTGSTTLFAISGTAAQFTSVTGAFSGSGTNLNSIPNNALINNSVTIGSTNISLGGSTTIIEGILTLTGSIITGSTAQFTTITGTNVNITQNLVVDGNLTVSGTATILEVENLRIEDPIIVLGSSSAGSSLTDGDRGLIFSLTGSNQLAFGWDHSEKIFKLGSTNSIGLTTDLDITPSGTLHLGSLILTGSIFVSGSSIYGQVAELTSSTTTYTLVVQDSGKFLNVNSASPVDVIVPSGLPTGFTLSMCQLGAGQITISASVGVVINNRQSHTKTSGQYAVVSIVGTSVDSYVLIGDTTS